MADQGAAAGVLSPASFSALVNANTAAVTILLPSISEDVGAAVAVAAVAMVDNTAASSRRDSRVGDLMDTHERRTSHGR